VRLPELCPVCHHPMKRFVIEGKGTWKCMNIKAHDRALRDERTARPGRSSGRQGNRPLRKKK
jgi:hypothetical protein